MAYREPELCSDGERPVGVAPELDLLAQCAPRKAMAVQPALVPPSPEQLEKLMALRDEFVQIKSAGRFVDAAAREWRELPSNWRMALLLVAGVGLEVDNMATLASRNWQEFPEPERVAIKHAIRVGKRSLGRVTALAARV